jgi:cyclopropane-fatty-acyl-phospholipid synthase
MSLIDLCERGLIPDTLTRFGIRRLCAGRLEEEHAGALEPSHERFRRRLEELRASPVAIETRAANEQHYEVPPPFFQLCLGKRLKYSACFYPGGNESLDQAEEQMLRLTEQRAELADGIDILELGCGWGSLTLWMAERFPNARITGVSNSRPQREFIEAQCRTRGIGNVRIVTADVNQFAPEGRYERVVSIEMFEHMRNYDTLMARIASWLKPGGKLFVHIFCHRELMYPFEVRGTSDWMSKYFFTGGLMPAADTLLYFQRDLLLEEQWRLNGRHYQRTADHWLANQDRNATEVTRVLEGAYGAAQAKLWHQRWRMFWMACAELFGYRDGNEWLVGHYRFVRR